MALNYEVVIKGGNKAFDVFNNLNKINEMSEKINKIYEKMGNTTLPKVNNKLKEIKKSNSELNDTFGALKDMFSGNYQSALNKLGGQVKNSMSGVFDTFNKGFSRGRGQGMSFFQSLQRGMGGVTKAFSAGTLSIKGILTGLAASLGPFLAIAAVVVAAIYTIKTAWKMNLGGMQSEFNKLVGQLKSWWGKFNASFMAEMRKWTPIIKTIVSFFSIQFKVIGNTLKSVFTFIWNAISPIVEVVRELFNAFGGVNSESKSLKMILDGIFTAFSAIGKVVGFVLKIGLYPLLEGIRAIGKMVTWVREAWDAFTETKAFKVIQTFIDGIKMAFNALAKLVGVKTEDSQAAKASVNNIRSTSQDNRHQNIVFNTNRATTPEQTQAFADILAKQLA